MKTIVEILYISVSIFTRYNICFHKQGRNGKTHSFNHPLVMLTFMSLGKMSILLVYILTKQNSKTEILNLSSSTTLNLREASSWEFAMLGGMDTLANAIYIVGFTLTTPSTAEMLW